MLRGVLFDLDDTLADSLGTEEKVWVGVAEVLVERYPDVDRVVLRERYLEALERHYPDLAAGRTDLLTFRRDRLADALEPWGEVDDDLLGAYLAQKARILDEIVPFPDAIPTVRKLRRAGLRVGILTNGPSAFQRRKLETTGLAAEVDAIAVSGELGVAKPLREAFDAALALLEVAAADAAMVGDSLENDVLGALDAGLAAAVWMPGRRTGDPPPAALRAERVADVPSLLGLE